MEISALIRRGNIVSTEWKGERSIGCYLGNGRFGAVMAGTGLNLSPEQEEDPHKNRSHFRHIRHWGRFALTSPFTQEKTSADYLLPLFRLWWEREYADMTQYHQCHDVYDGVLTTRFQPKGMEEIAVTSWFDAVKRDVFAAVIQIPPHAEMDNRICLSPVMLFNPWGFMCRENYQHTVSMEKEGEQWVVSMACERTVNQASAKLYIQTDMAAEAEGDCLYFRLHGGENQILISVGEPVFSENAAESLLRTKEQNHAQWAQCGWMEYPREDMQKVWVRSMAYLMSSYDSNSEYIQPANSMGINSFPYNFVPDIGNIAPSLSMLGRGDIVRHWVERFAGQIEDMRRYARFLWPEAEGIFPPWELNFGPIEGYHSPNAPMIFFYEAHNTGYLAKMAMEALEHSDSEEWNRTYVYPLILECARFFRRFCHKEEDGLWHLTWYPCMGRDEAGGENKDDYLCTLIAAKYTFQSAIRCGLDETGDCARILSEGLAFESLMSDRGTLHTCRGADDFGKQKHPVQLEGLACFPMEPAPLEVEKTAYGLRHQITMETEKLMYYGWTIAQLLMAGTNLKNYEEWQKDWDLLLPSKNTDEMWIQFFESCGLYKSAFYTATHGMVLQSLIRNCVNDYWGRLEIGSCLAPEGCVQFENIRTRLGVSVSGKVKNGRASGSITAYRDTNFAFLSETISMRRGETMQFDFAL